MNKNMLYTLLLIFVSFYGIGQKTHHSNLIFEPISAEVGFYNTGFHDFLEDYQGFIWMATWSGLARYDGYTVKMYQQGNSHLNLHSNIIIVLFEDSQDNLWIGTAFSGFYRYNRNKDSFEQFCNNPNDANSLSNNTVRAIEEDKYGNLWIATENGLNKYNPQTNHFSHYFNEPNNPKSLLHNNVYTISISENNSIWVGTEKGINRVITDKEKEHFIRYDLNPKNELINANRSHNFIYKIIPSKFHENVFWVCTNNGLKKIVYSDGYMDSLKIDYWRHDPKDPNSLSHPFIPNVYEEDSIHLWVATYDGLNYVNHKTGKNVIYKSQKDNPQSIDGNYITGISKDSYNNLWVGLENGINKVNLNTRKFQNITSKILHNKETISCLANASDNKGIWAGSKGSGLHYLPINEGEFILGESINFQFPTDAISKLSLVINEITIDDDDGWLWVATDGGGVFKIKETSVPTKSGLINKFQHFSSGNNLTNNYVMSLTYSRTGDTWIGYWSTGISRYDKHTATFHHYSWSKDSTVNFNQFPIVHIIESIEGNRSYLWLGTRGGGLYKVLFDVVNNNLEVVKHYKNDNKNENKISNNFINSFLLDKQKRLWVGTEYGLNLLNNDTDQFIIYKDIPNLKAQSVGSLVADNRDNIWLTSGQGISKLDFRNDKLLVKNFDVFDGQIDNSFLYDAVLKTSTNHIIFGGSSGYTIFLDNKTPTDTIVPKVIITDFKLFNQSVPIGELPDKRTILSKQISETKAIELTHKDNVLSFEFKGLHFKDPKRLKYAYQLEGVNPNWVYTDANQRIAQYNNLPYDQYIFSVKSANEDGVWSQPTTIKLTVHPPFWLTWWAYCIYFLLILGILYIGIYWTKLQAAYSHNLELERFEKEKIKEVNRLKIQFFTNISHELRTPLTLIISPLEQLISNNIERKAHHTLTRMYQNATRLLVMINQLLDIRRNDAGLMNLEVSQQDIVWFVKEIIISFQNFAIQKNIELNFSTDTPQILAWFDPNQMEKVIYNLLSNAFKFTEEGGRIDVNIIAEEKITIIIRDTGIGIPAEQIPNIFDRFFLLKNKSKTIVANGSGIGLSLVKAIIKKHFGNIDVESVEGKGTSFFVNLLKGKEHFKEEELALLDKSMSKN